MEVRVREPQQRLALLVALLMVFAFQVELEDRDSAGEVSLGRAFFDGRTFLGLGLDDLLRLDSSEGREGK